MDILRAYAPQYWLDHQAEVLTRDDEHPTSGGRYTLTINFDVENPTDTTYFAELAGSLAIQKLKENVVVYDAEIVDHFTPCEND